jgi:uncharacterized membrane-anchored protein YhcB (DUF1043 family)
MRILVAVCAAVAMGVGVLSTLLWRQLGTERQHNQALQTQLDEARGALAARPVVQAAPLVAAGPPAAGASVAQATAPAKVSHEEAMAIVTAEIGKTQKKLLDDPEYRKARVDQVRQRMKQRYAGLAEELGLSQQEMDALIDLLANGGRRLTDAQKRSLTAVIVAEQKRQQDEAQSLRNSGQNALVSQQDRAAEGNRRILDAAAGFLDAQQLELVRGRFQQRSAIDRAQSQVQQSVLEATQGGTN